MFRHKGALEPEATVRDRFHNKPTGLYFSISKADQLRLSQGHKVIQGAEPGGQTAFTLIPGRFTQSQAANPSKAPATEVVKEVVHVRKHTSCRQPKPTYTL